MLRLAKGTPGPSSLFFLQACCAWSLGSQRATADKLPPVQDRCDFSYTASLRASRKMHWERMK